MYKNLTYLSVVKNTVEITFLRSVFLRHIFHETSKNNYSVFLFTRIKDGYIISEESTKGSDHYIAGQQMLNEHVINSCIVYMYCFVQTTADLEMPANMGYCK